MSKGSRGPSSGLMMSLQYIFSSYWPLNLLILLSIGSGCDFPLRCQLFDRSLSFNAQSWFQKHSETLLSIQCSHLEEMKWPSTKYTECWSVGMCRATAGHTEVRLLSAVCRSKSQSMGDRMLIGCMSAEDPPAGPSRGIKAAIWTPFLSWWVEIWSKTNPPCPLQLCPPLSVKESSKETYIYIYSIWCICT